MRGAFNLKAKYILVAEIIYKGKIDKLIISEFNGRRRKISQSEFIRLVYGDKIANCRIINNQLKGLGMSLRHITKYDRSTGQAYRMGKEVDIIREVNEYKKSKTYRLTGRVMEGKECKAYEVTSLSGESGIFKRADVILMVKLGYIENVSYQLYKGKSYIKGVGFNISELKSVQLID